MSKKLEDLKAKQKAIALRIKREQNKLTGAERKDDTRRKVLVGAALLQAATKDAELGKRINAELQAFLVRNNDRALFGLPHTEEAKAS